MTHINSFSHALIHHFHRHREIDELYISIAIRAFGLGLVNVFVPIYLLTLGFSLKETLSYILVTFVIHLLLLLPAGAFVSKHGPKHAMLLSSIPLTFALLTLHSLDFYPQLFLTAAVLFGVANAYFWTGYHYDLSKISSFKSRGTQIGIALILWSIFGALGPIAGAGLMNHFGYSTTFMVAMAIVFLSVIPLFLSSDNHRSFGIKYSAIWRRMTLKNTIPLFGGGLEGTVWEVLWPLFIYLYIAKSILVVGLAISVGLIIATFSAALVGKAINRNRYYALWIGSLFSLIIWPAKFFIRSANLLYAVDALHGSTRSVKMVAFNAIRYDNSNRQYSLEDILHQEFVIISAGILLIGGAIVLGSVYWAPFIAALATILMVFYRRN